MEHTCKNCGVKFVEQRCPNCGKFRSDSDRVVVVNLLFGLVLLPCFSLGSCILINSSSPNVAFGDRILWISIAILIFIFCALLWKFLKMSNNGRPQK